ncbi:hypothetical protein EDB85DRAFT_984791 [Lactarius pseudohatsudake]|nr:hypothetical protein EDB85DRAFT_984791 [Lactarius pseudohatsudake]
MAAQDRSRPSTSQNPRRGFFGPLLRVPILGQELSLDSPQIDESQENPSRLRVQVTVLRAHNIPNIKNRFGLKFFVTVTSQATKEKTSSVPTKGPTAVWNENLHAFIVQPSSHLVLRLYAVRFARRDILVGTHEMTPVESQTDVPFPLANSGSQAGQSNQPVTLYLTVVVSPITTPHPVLLNNANLQSTGVNESPPVEATEPSMTQGATDPTQSTVASGSETLSPPTDRLPSEMGTPVPSAADQRAGMSPAEDAPRDTDEAVTTSVNTTRSTVATGSETLSPPTDRHPNLSIPPAADRQAGTSLAEKALHGAGEAVATINLSNTWEGALERIKWVMDTVSPVAELHPYAKMAYGLLFAIPKTLLEQFQRDDNIRTLLAAMHDSFDFANQEDRFKAIGRDSKQARILRLMLQHVCNCCDFIRSYAKDSQFCT